MKESTLIVFQDGHADLERTARSLGDRLESEKRQAIVKPASKISIPELLAATFFIFGADEAGASSFAEIVRVLNGINLAGRRVAFFGTNGAAVAWLKNMAADSELGPVASDLVGIKPDPATIAAWARSIS